MYVNVRSNMQIINKGFGLQLWFLFVSFAGIWLEWPINFQQDFVQSKLNFQGQVSSVLVLRPFFSTSVIKYSCLHIIQSPQTSEKFDLILQKFITIVLLTSLLFGILCKHTDCSKYSRQSTLWETVHLLTHKMCYILL